MDKVNLGLAKFLQFVVIVFFTFVLAFYFGSLLLIPLAILIGLVDILTAIGFNGIFASILAVPAAGWICYTIYNIPGLFQALLDTGIKIYDISKAQNTVFEGISKGMQAEEKTSETVQKTTESDNSNNSDNNDMPTIKPA